MDKRTIKLNFEGNTKKLADQLEKDLSATIKRLNSSLQKLQFSPPASTSKKNNSLSGIADFDTKAVLAEMKKYQQARITLESQLTAHVTKQSDLQNKARLNSLNLTLNDYRSTFNQIRKIESSGIQNSIAVGAAGGAVGAIVSKAIGFVTSYTGEVKDLGLAAIKLGADFQGTTNSMAVFTGSLPSARRELAHLAEVSLDTPGLGLEEAELGSTRLRALMFDAKTTENILVGLSKHKILSNADSGAVDRAVTNLGQLSVGSPRMSADIKELLNNLPTLRRTVIETFGSVDKFKKSLGEDTSSTFSKFAEAVANTKASTGGLNDSASKLRDEVILLGRDLTQPIIEPLDDAVKRLTSTLDSNRRSWSDWGEWVGGVIKNVNGGFDDYADFEKNYKPSGKMPEHGFYDLWGGASSSYQNRVENFQREEKETAYQKWLRDQYGDNFNKLGISEKGNIRAQRKVLENVDLSKRDKALDYFGVASLNRDLLSDKDSRKYVADYDKESALWKNATDETNALLANIELNKQTKRDTDRKNQLADLQATSDERISIITNSFKVEQSKRDLQQRYTLSQEKSFSLESGKLEAENIRAQISMRESFYKKQFAVSDLNEREIVEMTSKKNKELGDLNAQLQVSEFQTQKKIQDYERQILEQRRQAQIESKQLLIRGAGQDFDTANYDANRRIDRSTDTGGFSDLIVNSQKYYTDLQRITKESYDLRLKDLTLSTEQIANIQKEAQLEEIRIREDGRRATIEIEEKKWNRVIELTQSAAKYTQDLINLTGQGAGAFSDFFSTDRFSKGNLDYVLSQLTNPRQTEFDALKQRKVDFRDSSISSAKAALANGDLISSESFKIDALEAEKAIKSLDAQIQQANKDSNFFAAQFKELGKVLGDTYNFDAVKLKLLEDSQARQNLNLQSEIKLANNLIGIRKKEKNGAEVAKLERELELLLGQQKALEVIQLLEFQRAKSETTEGRKARAERLATGDTGEYGALRDIADKRYWDEISDSYIQIYNLRRKISDTPLIDNLAIEVAQLQKIAELRGRETEAIIRTQAAQLELNERYKISGNQIRANIYEHLAAQKTLNEAISDGMIGAYEKVADWMDKGLGKFADIPLLGDLAKFNNRSVLTKISTGLLENIAPDFAKQLSKTGNPIVDAIQDSNNYLKTISNAVTGKSVAGSIGGASSGGGFGPLSWLGNLATGGSTYGSGASRGGLIFHNNAGFGGMDDPGVHGGGESTGSGSLWGSIKNLFSTKEGGLFAKRQNILTGKDSKLGGILGGAGDVASMLAPLFGGGKISAVIGMAGKGASIGSMAGPWGAAIGAGVGALIGLFTGGTRKADEKTRDSLMVETLKQLTDIKTQMDSKKSVDVDSLLSNASSVKDNYFSVANTLKDKKTRNIAIKDGNESVTPLYNSIVEASALARTRQAARESADERYRRLIPEFAAGGYIPSRNGGHLAIVGEGGHDEYILSTDPKYRQRTMGLLSNFAEKMALNIPKHASGGITSFVPTMPQFNDFQPATKQGEGDTYEFNFNIEAGANITAEDIKQVFDSFLNDSETKSKIAKVTVDKRRFRESR